MPQVIACEGCGHEWPVTPGPARLHRVTRCYFCPPAEAAPPDLQSQLETLLDEVWHDEASWRLDDRLDLAFREFDRQTHAAHRDLGDECDCGDCRRKKLR